MAYTHRVLFLTSKMSRGRQFKAHGHQGSGSFYISALSSQLVTVILSEGHLIPRKLDRGRGKGRKKIRGRRQKGAEAAFTMEAPQVTVSYVS